MTVLYFYRPIRSIKKDQKVGSRGQCRHHCTNWLFCRLLPNLLYLLLMSLIVNVFTESKEVHTRKLFIFLATTNLLPSKNRHICFYEYGYVWLVMFDKVGISLKSLILHTVAFFTNAYRHCIETHTRTHTQSHKTEGVSM